MSFPYSLGDEILSVNFNDKIKDLSKNKKLLAEIRVNTRFYYIFENNGENFLMGAELSFSESEYKIFYIENIDNLSCFTLSENYISFFNSIKNCVEYFSFDRVSLLYTAIKYIKGVDSF